MSADRAHSPDQGELADHPLPRLLLDLSRRGFTGWLALEHDGIAYRFAWRRGRIVVSESNRDDDGLAAGLLAAGRITAAQSEAVKAHCEKRRVVEPAALLGLGILDAKALVEAMRSQILRRAVDVFGWTRGRFSVEEGPGPDEESEAFRVEPIQVIQDGLATYWRPDQILGDLSDRLERYAVPSERFASVVARLAPGPETDAVTQAIDPRSPFSMAAATSLAPQRLAVAWLLAESGALDFSDAPAEAPPEPDAAPDAEPAAEEEAPLEFEIEVRGASDEADDDEDEGAALALELPSDEAEELRKEVLSRHERLDELDFYEILGIEPEANDGAVKKAYFAAAKRFHPDAVARMGLQAIHREANELFARIAQAYQTLSNAQRRKDYDTREESAEVGADANRVAQAETLFRKGEVLAKVGNFKGALDFLRPCVELWPEEADYQALLGWALYKAKPSDPKAAREHLEKADALRSDDPLVLFRLGMVLRHLGEQDAAQIYLDRSKSLEKNAKG